MVLGDVSAAAGGGGGEEEVISYEFQVFSFGKNQKLKNLTQRARREEEGTEKRARCIVPLREEAGVELEGGGEMVGEVGGVVAAGVDVEFVGDVA